MMALLISEAHSCSKFISLSSDTKYMDKCYFFTINISELDHNNNDTMAYTMALIKASASIQY